MTVTLGLIYFALKLISLFLIIQKIKEMIWKRHGLAFLAWSLVIIGAYVFSGNLKQALFFCFKLSLLILLKFLNSKLDGFKPTKLVLDQSQSWNQFMRTRWVT
jgi:hypothetical protein